MAFDTILLPCPLCRKGTAPAFMWHLNETEWMCLVCYQTYKDEIATGGRKYVRSSLKGGSKNGHYGLKAVAAFVGGAAGIGGRRLSVLPSSGQRDDSQNHRAGAGGSGQGRRAKEDGPAQPDGQQPEPEIAQEPPTDKSEQAPSDAKPESASPNIADAAASAAGKKERIAPTVQAPGLLRVAAKTLKKDIQTPQALKDLVADSTSARSG